MSRKTEPIALIIALVAVCLAGIALFMSMNPPAAEDKDIQYVMYLGTNDKDTDLPYGTSEEAKAKADEILYRHFDGFTIQEAYGGWTNEDGIHTHEYTLVIYISDTTPEKIYAAADDLLTEFDQNTVLIQTNETVTEFYSGSE